MPREVFRCGQRVSARARDLYLTDEELKLLRDLAQVNGVSQGELVGNLLRQASIRAARLAAEQEVEDARAFRLRAGGEQ